MKFLILISMALTLWACGEADDPEPNWREIFQAALSPNALGHAPNGPNGLGLSGPPDGLGRFGIPNGLGQSPVQPDGLDGPPDQIGGSIRDLCIRACENLVLCRLFKAEQCAACDDPDLNGANGTDRAQILCFANRSSCESLGECFLDSGERPSRSPGATPPTPNPR